MSLEIVHPKLSHNDLSQKLFRENFIAYGGEYTHEELALLNQIVLNAALLMEGECYEREKSGFMLAVAIDDKPTIVVQLGEINEKREPYGPDGAKLKYADFADAKIEFLKQNPTCSRSSQNNNEINATTTLLKEKVVGGAIAFSNGVKIAISGLSSIAVDDENATLELGESLGFKEAILNIS